MSLRNALTCLLSSIQRCVVITAGRAQSTAPAAAKDAEEFKNPTKAAKVAFKLTEEEIEIRDAFRNYCQEKLTHGQHLATRTDTNALILGRVIDGLQTFTMEK